jgi:RNA polymerase sigma factor (sigma-70 family)
MYIPQRFNIIDDNLDLLRRFSAYIKLVVTHARTDYLRKDRKTGLDISLDALPPEKEAVYPAYFADLQSEFDFDNERIALAFSHLSPLRRQILAYMFVEGISPQAIAGKLNITVDNVYLHKHRAVQALRNELSSGKES